MTTILTANTLNEKLDNFHNAHLTHRINPIEKSSNVIFTLANQIIDTLDLWKNRYQQRRQLAEMDQFRFSDIGVNTAEVSREIAKPFWIK